MAVLTKRIEVCDVCKDPERPVVERVRIARERESIRLLMVCSQHAKPVREALEMAKHSRVLRKTGPTAAVVTLDQIEKVKRGRRKSASEAPEGA